MRMWDIFEDYNRRKFKRMYSETEIKTWLSIVDNLKQGNVFLKNRLSEAVKGPLSDSLIDSAESFQQNFINKDQIIDLLRHDITDLLAGLSKRTMADNNDDKISLLHRDVERIVLEFDKMKYSFEHFLSQLA